MKNKIISFDEQLKKESIKHLAEKIPVFSRRTDNRLEDRLIGYYENLEIRDDGVYADLVLDLNIEYLIKKSHKEGSITVIDEVELMGVSL